jgi:hypothetical protein
MQAALWREAGLLAMQVYPAGAGIPGTTCPGTVLRSVTSAEALPPRSSLPARHALDRRA